MKPQLTATPIPTQTQNITVNLTHQFEFVQPVLYYEGMDEYMFRTSGHWLGEWVRYKRDDVEGFKDIDMRATVYRAMFLPNYRYWSVSWGQYFPQVPKNDMKYLVVFARIQMEGTTQDDDPRMWGPGQDHFIVQNGNETYTTDKTHEIGYRIKELEDINDMMNVSKIYDYGYSRFYDWTGTEKASELGYIRMGVSNAWDGYLLFEISRNATMDNLKVLERIDGIGNVWWNLEPKPLS